MTEKLLQIFLAFFSVFQLTGAEYKYDYLSDPCESDVNNRILYLEPNETFSGIIWLTKQYDYGTNLNCNMKLVALSGYELYIYVSYVDIYNPGDIITCDDDYLEIRYGGLLPYRTCGTGTPDIVILAENGTAEIQFVSGTYDSPNDSGFTLHYNLFRIGTCTEGEFTCTPSGYSGCISSELTCDGKNNCGNAEDEWNSVCGLSGGAIAAIVITSVAIGGTVIAFAIYIAYETKNRKKREREQAARRAQVRDANLNAASITPAVRYNAQYGANIEPPPAYTFSSNYVNPYASPISATDNVSTAGSIYDPIPVYSAPYATLTSTASSLP